MKTIVRRKDNTSIFCPSINQRPTTITEKKKFIGLTTACILLVVGFFILIITL